MVSKQMHCVKKSWVLSFLALHCGEKQVEDNQSKSKGKNGRVDCRDMASWSWEKSGLTRVGKKKV